MGEQYTITRRYLESDPSNKYPLGRHVNHDSRSKSFEYKAEHGTTINSVTHLRQKPILDQGEISSCTGNACIGVLSTKPHKLLPEFFYDESDAVDIYSAATRIDAYAGIYPPDDSGSDGLSVAKVATNLGLCSGYQHTFTLDSALLALQTYPIMVGTNWYESMFEPNSSGKVSISPDSQIAGGHEYEVFGCDIDNKVVWADNSWGTSWGKQGTFCFSFDTFERLLGEQGDVTVLIPIELPAPTPVPPPVDPVHSKVDILFAKQLRVNFIGKPNYKPMQRYAQTWLDKKGL